MSNDANQAGEAKHNHTPWPEYRKALTTGGYSIEWVDEVMQGLTATWSCPACDAEGLPIEEVLKIIDAQDSDTESTDMRKDDPSEQQAKSATSGLDELIYGLWNTAWADGFNKDKSSREEECERTKAAILALYERKESR